MLRMKKRLFILLLLLSFNPYKELNFSLSFLSSFCVTFFDRLLYFYYFLAFIIIIAAIPIKTATPPPAMANILLSVPTELNPFP